MQNTPNDLVSIRKAAQQAGIPYRVLMSAVYSGQIKSVTFATRRLVSLSALHEYVQRSLDQTTPALAA